MNNLASRSITGAGFVVVMIGSALLGLAVFSILFLIVSILGLREYFAMVGKDQPPKSAALPVVCGSIIYTVIALNANALINANALTLVIPLLLLPLIATLWRKSKDPAESVGKELLGMLYIPVPLSLSLYFFNPVYQGGTAHYGVMIGYLGVLWMNDTGAYLVGSLIGRNKLFERISPKKTWEGSAGGAITALATAWGASHLFGLLELWQWLVLALLVVLFGTLGDLVESMFKRSMGLKDSGNLLPGHGGILDRFDAMLISVPFVFVFLTLFC